MGVSMPGMDARLITGAPAGSTVSIALVAHAALPTGIEKGIRFATSDAEHDHATLLTKGASVDEVLRWLDVPAMFAFRDPDGSGYEIVEQA